MIKKGDTKYAIKLYVKQTIFCCLYKSFDFLVKSLNIKYIGVSMVRLYYSRCNKFYYYYIL